MVRFCGTYVGRAPVETRIWSVPTGQQGLMGACSDRLPRRGSNPSDLGFSTLIGGVAVAPPAGLEPAAKRLVDAYRILLGPCLTCNLAFT